MGCESSKNQGVSETTTHPVVPEEKELEEKEPTVLQQTTSAPARLFPGAVESPPPSFHRKYILKEQLGEGTFSRVYACRERKSIRHGQVTDLAVKITDLRGLASYTGGRRKRAQDEVSILQKINNHQHCSKIVDVMDDPDFHYIVQEKYNMSLLTALTCTGDVTELTVARLVSQMFQGVATVHALGVVHRDIKPDNFLCSFSGAGAVVKLIDFGLAQVLPSSSASITGYCGTAPYMSPEMVQGLAYSKPTDVWSLGVIIYTILFGQFPYIPARPCRILMRAAIAAGEPEPSFVCAAADIEYSQQVLTFLKILLCRDPARRPQAIEALRDRWFRLDSGRKRSLRKCLESAKSVGAFEGRAERVIIELKNWVQNWDNPDKTSLTKQECEALTFEVLSTVTANLKEQIDEFATKQKSQYLTLFSSYLIVLKPDKTRRDAKPLVEAMQSSISTRSITRNTRPVKCELQCTQEFKRDAVDRKLSEMQHLIQQSPRQAKREASELIRTRSDWVQQPIAQQKGKPAQPSQPSQARAEVGDRQSPWGVMITT